MLFGCKVDMTKFVQLLVPPFQWQIMRSPLRINSENRRLGKNIADNQKVVFWHPNAKF